MMKGPLHLFFQSNFQEQRENVLNSPIVRDDAHSHDAPRTNGSSYESPRRQRDWVTLINSKSPQSSYLTIPSLDPFHLSSVKSKSKSPPTNVSRWDESPDPCTQSPVLSPPPRHPPRRTSLDYGIEATKKSSQRKDSRPTTMDSFLASRDSVSSLQLPRRPSRRYINNTMLGQPVFSSTSLNDAAVHSYHENQRNNSLLSPSMPRRQGSFPKKAGAMAPPSPPIRSVSNSDEASLRYMEGILGKALEHCSLELQPSRRPTRRHIKEDTMLEQPVSTSLKDDELHRYHNHKKNNSLLSPFMPRRQGSFSKKSGAMALPSPPIWSDSNNEEASPSH
jgi:hypothetical protein